MLKVAMYKIICKIKIRNETSNVFHKKIQKQRNMLASLRFNIAFEELVRDDMDSTGIVLNKFEQTTVHADDLRAAEITRTFTK